MRRAFISEAVNLRKDTAAAGGEDKQADDNFLFHLNFNFHLYFLFCVLSRTIITFLSVAKENVCCQPI